MKNFFTNATRRPRNILVAGIVALSLTGVSMTTFAKGHHQKFENMTEQERLEHMENRLDKRMEKLTKKLALNDAQAKQVRVILSTEQTERMDIKSRHQGDREAAKPEMKELRERTQVELAKVLSQDQIDTMKQMKKRHHKRGKHKRNRLQHMEKELNLTPEQSTQIKAIHKARKAQAHQLIEAAGGDREAAKPELKKLRQESMQEVRAILTPEQQTKFDALKEKRKDGRKGKRRGKQQ